MDTIVPNKAKTSKLLENLRKFRFQKKHGYTKELKANGKHGTDSHYMSESENDSRHSEKKEKKSRIKNRAALEESDSEKKSSKSPKKYSRIKRHRDDSSSSSDEDKSKKKEKEHHHRHHHHHHHKSKKHSHSHREAKKPKKEEVSEEEKWSDTVLIDSDEYNSDTQVSDEMTPTKVKVFEFLNTATILEFLQVQSCTEKKANFIIEQRPYLGWRDVIFKFKNFKSVNIQLLDYMIEALKTRDIVSKLMTRCLDLAISTEKAIKDGATTLKEQPSNVTKELKLKSYQMVGLNWLAVMHQQKLNGILADEMGLGKTVQVITFLAYLMESGYTKYPHLIVAPSSTIDNWAIEFTRWCPSLRVVIYHGSAEERRGLRYQWFKEKFKTMDVIITTYNIVGSNPEEKKMFKIINLQYVVFDEAHMLKNMNTQRYYNLFNINAMHRILLTGTPLQNNLLELMSLLNFVMPNMFSKKIQYIKTYFSKNSKVQSENSVSTFEEEQIDLAKRIMKPFVLRRLKQDVLKDLPTKTNKVIFCPLHEEQKVKYSEMLEELREWSQNKEDSGYSFMSSFMQLRKLANHPLTCRYLYSEETIKEMASRLSTDYLYKENNEQYILDDINGLSDHEIHKLTLENKCISRFKLEDSHFLKSGKFTKLDELLPKLKEGGHRVVMFSQFVFVLDLLEDYMRIRGHSFLRLDGSTNILERQELIDNFNEDSDVFVFLLTTRAGGVGINLTSADTVIIHDVDFNPYNDKQAEDRCHRLGQTRPVEIIRLVSEGTVEEKIFAQAQSKLELEQGLIGKEEDSNDGKNVELLLKEVLGMKK